MQIYTSYYAQIKNFSKEGIKPISISLGTPKFIKSKMTKVFLLAPNRSMFGLDYHAYKKLYFEKLAKTDFKLVKEILDTSSQGKPIALLCYESLKTEGEFCHRTMLAEYLNEHHQDKFGTVIEWQKQDKVEVSTNQIDMF